MASDLHLQGIDRSLFTRARFAQLPLAWPQVAAESFELLFGIGDQLRRPLAEHAHECDRRGGARSGGHPSVQLREKYGELLKLVAVWCDDNDLLVTCDVMIGVGHRT